MRDELDLYLNKLLACDDFDDYAPNGIQVAGQNQISRICTAVTASLDAINQAIHLKADALLVHHGYFWRGESPVLTGMKHERIAKLIEHKITLFAYHLPLDCHKELGNNACLARLFNLNSIDSHKIGKTRDLLWSGLLPEPRTAKEFAAEAEEKLGRKPVFIEANEKPIQKLAWCSGAAQDLIEEAHKLGVDAYISGEISERTYYQAKELGINYFACGHHATERYGIQALGNHLADKYKFEHHFIDSFNPV